MKIQQLHIKLVPAEEESFLSLITDLSESQTPEEHGAENMEEKLIDMEAQMRSTK